MRRISILFCLLITISVSAFALNAPDTDSEKIAQITKVMEQGTPTSISYTILVSSVGMGAAEAGGAGGQIFSGEKSYSQNGEIKGWEYKDGNKTYILLKRSDWEGMYDECMPNGISRAFGETIVEQKIKTDNYIYTHHGNSLLNHSHYTVEGVEYTMIKLFIDK